MTKADKVEYIRKAFEEAGTLATKVVDGILDDDDEIEESRAALRELYGDLPEDADNETIAASRADGRFKPQVDALRADVATFIDGARDLHITKRECRKLTPSRREMFDSLALAFDSAAADVRGIVEATTPKPVADQNALAMQLLALRAKHSPLAID